ncbi:hypothetical protein J2R98_002719 [Alkalibacillus filiformis]|uniref:DUF4179 domain-containing protein n=1 Tax=Alkalibacillus filiformis TaxID=200990 RepID=A0ABU0DWL7_9BACI|nr:DUF4179 domain-containing protein [Alkalibacillus filiformis]MDQ0352868.1 hypothetical protein [Alkalibacillus filiformis]
MKMLYKQLSRLKIEDHEIEPMEVNELEKERIKNKAMKHKKKRWSKNVPAAAIVLSSVMTFIVAISFANPALATNLPLISNIYEIFVDEETYVFEEYDEHSTNLDLSKESDGVTVTLTDAVYDLESVTVAYTIESEKDLGDAPFLDGRFVIESMEEADETVYTPGRFMTEKINDNKYAGVYIHYLLEGEVSQEIDVNWVSSTISQLYEEENSVDGDWSFEFSLEATEKDTYEYTDLKSYSEGIEVELDQMTSTTVAANFYFTENISRDAFGKDEYVSIRYTVADNLGNEYNVLPNAGYGDNKYNITSRITTTSIHEVASTIFIIPEVSTYATTEDNDLELVKEPYELDQIEIPLVQ